MPDVVLRHPDVPQPLVVFVAPGQYVPGILRDAGWEIDSKTSPEDANAEIEDVTAKALAAAEAAAESFVASFPPDGSDDSAPAAPSVSKPTGTQSLSISGPTLVTPTDPTGSDAPAS